MEIHQTTATWYHAWNTCKDRLKALAKAFLDVKNRYGESWRNDFLMSNTDLVKIRLEYQMQKANLEALKLNGGLFFDNLRLMETYRNLVSAKGLNMKAEHFRLLDETPLPSGVPGTAAENPAGETVSTGDSLPVNPGLTMRSRSSRGSPVAAVGKVTVGALNAGAPVNSGSSVEGTISQACVSAPATEGVVGGAKREGAPADLGGSVVDVAPGPAGNVSAATTVIVDVPPMPAGSNSGGAPEMVDVLPGNTTEDPLAIPAATPLPSDIPVSLVVLSGQDPMPCVPAATVGGATEVTKNSGALVDPDRGGISTTGEKMDLLSPTNYAECGRQDGADHMDASDSSKMAADPEVDPSTTKSSCNKKGLSENECDDKVALAGKVVKTGCDDKVASEESFSSNISNELFTNVQASGGAVAILSEGSLPLEGDSLDFTTKIAGSGLQDLDCDMDMSPSGGENPTLHANVNNVACLEKDCSHEVMGEGDLNASKEAVSDQNPDTSKGVKAPRKGHNKNNKKLQPQLSPVTGSEAVDDIVDNDDDDEFLHKIQKLEKMFARDNFVARIQSKKQAARVLGANYGNDKVIEPPEVNPDDVVTEFCSFDSIFRIEKTRFIILDGHTGDSSILRLEPGGNFANVHLIGAGDNDCGPQAEFRAEGKRFVIENECVKGFDFDGRCFSVATIIGLGSNAPASVKELVKKHRQRYRVPESLPPLIEEPRPVTPAEPEVPDLESIHRGGDFPALGSSSTPEAVAPSGAQNSRPRPFSYAMAAASAGRRVPAPLESAAEIPVPGRRNVVRFKWEGKTPIPPHREFMQLLLGTGVKVVDLFAVLAPENPLIYYDVSFLSQQGLDSFMEERLKYTKGHKWHGFVVIPLSRQSLLRRAHVVVTNESIPVRDLVVWVQHFAEIMSPPQKVLDDLGVWWGGYDFDVKLKVKDGVITHIPRYSLIGRDRVTVHYPGQPRTCNKCGGRGHLASNCPSPRCGLCREFGHSARDCKRIRCNFCFEFGHPYTECPNSWLHMPLELRKAMLDPMEEEGAQMSIVSPPDVSVQSVPSVSPPVPVVSTVPPSPSVPLTSMAQASAAPGRRFHIRDAAGGAGGTPSSGRPSRPSGGVVGSGPEGPAAPVPPNKPRSRSLSPRYTRSSSLPHPAPLSQPDPSLIPQPVPQPSPSTLPVLAALVCHPGDPVDPGGEDSRLLEGKGSPDDKFKSVKKRKERTVKDLRYQTREALSQKRQDLKLTNRFEHLPNVGEVFSSEDENMDTGSGPEPNQGDTM